MHKPSWKLVGHRGFPGRYPENSLAGISTALELGADAIEIDIQFSCDGHPMVIHDDTLLRLANTQGAVTESSRENLALLSVHQAERFGDQFYPTRIPDLIQVVDLLREYPKTKLFVELKSDIFELFDRNHTVERIWEVLRAIKEQVVIIAFDLEVLRLVQSLKLSAVGWVISEYSKQVLQVLEDQPVDYVISNVSLFPPKEEQLWSGDWEWFVYDIIDPSKVRSLVDKGCKWIETNEIELLLSDRQS